MRKNIHKKMVLTCIFCKITEDRYAKYDLIKYKEYVCIDCEMNKKGYDVDYSKIDGISTYNVPRLSAGIK